MLIAKGSEIDDRREELRLFISALAKGTAAAVKDPVGADRAVLAAGNGLDPALNRAEIDATLPLLARTPKEPYGQMDAAEWELFGSWMAENGLISEVPSMDELLTNELLPPETG